MMTKTSQIRAFKGASLWPLAATVVLGLGACQPREELLPGERFDLREISEASASYEEQTAGGAAPVETLPPEPANRVPIAVYAVTGESKSTGLPAQRTNADWPTVNGSLTHQVAHPALGSNLVQVWSTQIGSGGTRRVRMTADPVVSGGKIFTLGAFGELQATSTAGGVLWRQDITPPSENAGEAAGGGLTVAGGRLYVNSPYGRLQVFDAVSGALIWEQRLGSVPNGAPAVSGDIVYLTTRDSRAWAIDAKTGRVLWTLDGAETGSVVNSGASPAVTSRAVIFPFGSGDIVAALKKGGVRLWSTTLSGERSGKAYTSVSDISASPVVVGSRVYIGTSNGRLAAMDVASGDRIWTAPEGALSPVWPEGNSIYLISDQAELVRLNSSDGSKIWSATLPLFTEEKVRKRRGIFGHFGPVLAGGRLITVSSDGLMREVDPESGRLLRSTDLGAPAAVNPVVAGQTLYVVTTNGQLHAFR